MPNTNKPIINDTPTLFVNVGTGGETTFKIAKSTFSDPLNGELEYSIPNTSSGSYYDPKTKLELVSEDDEYLYFHVDATQQNTSDREFFNLVVSNGVEETSLLIRVAIGIAQDQQTEAQWDVVIAQQENDHLTIGSFDEAYGSDGDDHFYYVPDGDPDSPYKEYASFTGGKGNDTYHVEQGQWVSINEVDRHNILILGAGLRKEDMRVNTSGDSITLTFAGKNGEKDTTISLHHHDQRSNAVDILDKIIFANGDTLNGHDLGVVTQNYGYPLTLDTRYDNQGIFSANMGDLYIKDSKNLGNLANGLSTTPDLGSEITIIGATLANGDPLPDWLVLDPATATFSGTMPKADDPIHLDLVIHTINTNGVVSYFDTSMYLPANWGMNRAPVINQTQQDLNFNEKSAWHYTIPTYLFRDPEYDRLTYQ